MFKHKVELYKGFWFHTAKNGRGDKCPLGFKLTQPHPDGDRAIQRALQFVDGHLTAFDRHPLIQFWAYLTVAPATEPPQIKGDSFFDWVCHKSMQLDSRHCCLCRTQITDNRLMVFMVGTKLDYHVVCLDETVCKPQEAPCPNRLS